MCFLCVPFFDKSIILFDVSVVSSDIKILHFHNGSENITWQTGHLSFTPTIASLSMLNIPFSSVAIGLL